jgi:hypothetical protein
LIEAFRGGDRARCGRAVRRHIEHFAKWVPREDAADAPAAPAPARARSRRSAAA